MGDLLVMSHGGNDLCRIEIPDGWSPSNHLGLLANRLRLGRREYSKSGGKSRRTDHTITDCLTVLESTVGGDSLERMTDRMSVIEDSPQSTLSLIGGDDIGLDLAAAGNEMGQWLIIEPLDRGQVGAVARPGQDGRYRLPAM